MVNFWRRVLSTKKPGTSTDVESYSCLKHMLLSKEIDQSSKYYSVLRRIITECQGDRFLASGFLLKDQTHVSASCAESNNTHVIIAECYTAFPVNTESCTTRYLEISPSVTLMLMWAPKYGSHGDTPHKNPSDHVIQILRSLVQSDECMRS